MEYVRFMLDRHIAAAAKSLQSCPTLCDPIDGSPPGSPIPGILQARTLEWVAISFSNAWKWTVKVKSLSRVWLLATPWTAAYQAPPSMRFSRQEYWYVLFFNAYPSGFLLFQWFCLLFFFLKDNQFKVRWVFTSFLLNLSRLYLLDLVLNSICNSFNERQKVGIHHDYHKQHHCHTEVTKCPQIIYLIILPFFKKLFLMVRRCNF